MQKEREEQFCAAATVSWPLKKPEMNFVANFVCRLIFLISSSTFTSVDFPKLMCMSEHWFIICFSNEVYVSSLSPITNYILNYVFNIFLNYSSISVCFSVFFTYPSPSIHRIWSSHLCLIFISWSRSVYLNTSSYICTCNKYISRIS